MRLQTKVLALTLPLTAAFAGFVSLTGRNATTAIMVNELERRLSPQVEDFAARMAPDLSSGPESVILRRLQAIQAFSGAASVEALSPAGKVLAHTNVLETGKLRADEPSRRALAADKTSAETVLGAKPLLILSVPVWRADEDFLLSGGPRRRLGTLRLALPLDQTLVSAQRVGTIVAGIAAAFSLLMLGLSLFLLRLVVRPIRSIVAATASVAAGDYAVDVPVMSRDEFGELAQAFNRMAAALSRTVVSRDRLEEALAIARATLEASADGIIVIDRDMRIVTYNRRYMEMWGVSEDVLLAGDARALIDTIKGQFSDPEAFLLQVEDTHSELEADEKRGLLNLRDGRVFDRISRPYRIQGKSIGRTITFRDLTLHVEGARALAQARDAALETARAKSQFLANISHELRTPLNAVVGSAELILDSELTSAQREHADTLGHAAKALLEMIDGVLDFSKIEAGRMTVERAPLKPREILSGAIALVAARAREKGLDLGVDAGEAADWPLEGDPTRLRQVLLNLLGNAIKFTKDGRVAAGVRVLVADAQKVELEFSVSDSGIGIDPAQGQKLFFPFTQADGSTTRRFGGTGLGLAISKSLVELMGGRIGFESEPDRGSKFWFTVKLDRATSQPGEALRRVPRTRIVRDRLRVLAVEDNAINRRLITRQLERLGYPSESAADGRAALDELGRADYGLILLDCQMPGLDGYQTAAEIRRREAGKKHTPIVAITANATDADRRRCLEAGMDDFIAKPATLESLHEVLERWDLPVDQTVLASFRALAADSLPDFIRLASQFLDDGDRRLMAARTAWRCGAWAQGGREAHALKGAAAVVGARGLAELCRRLEACAAALPAAFEGEPESLLDQADAELVRIRASSSLRPAE
jgi:PAS domain S-box-containing protein